MITVDLDCADKAALIALLKQEIAADPFRMSHRTKVLRGILVKLRGSANSTTASGTVKRRIKR